MVALAQKFDYPKSEPDLKTVIDTLYAETKRAIEDDELPRFKGLLEIILNRSYAFIRDKGKCRICSDELVPENVHIHHKNLNLPMSLVNRVVNLASVHSTCHRMIHCSEDYGYLGKMVWGKITDFREKLEGSPQTC